MNLQARRRSWRSLCLSAVLAMTGGPAFGETPSPEDLNATLLQFAPRLVELVNLAIFDPNLAARLVPDQLVEAAVIGAIGIVSEEPLTHLRAEDSHSWPVGPWQTPAELVASINSLYPEAVRGLYRALGPRFSAYCGVAQPPVSDCDGLFRSTVSRLSSPAVSARIAGNIAIPVTSTQREMGRLGRDVVAASEAKLGALERAVWGGDAAESTRD